MSDGGCNQPQEIKSLDELEEDEEKEIKPKLELPFTFEKELYEKQCKKIYIVEKFEPTEKVIPITEKFYSKYDNNKVNLNEKMFIPVIDNLHKLPIEKYSKPLLESHNIGWPSPEAQFLNKNVNRILAPKLRCDLTVFGEALGKEKVTERPEFVGEKFFLR